MKHTYPVFFIISVIGLSACHDDNNIPLSDLTKKTYSGSSLQLYYNGYAMPSKTVGIDRNGDKAHVKIYSLFDLSQTGTGMKGEIPAPGAIPGSPELDWNVALSPADGFWEFEGNGSNEFCNYGYQGYASADVMKLYLNNVALKSGGIKPEVWKPAPLVKDNHGIYESMPFYIDWQYDPIPGIDIDLSPIVKALATIPIIPVYNNTAYMSVIEAVSLILQTVAFKPDGNMIFTYLSTAFGAGQIAQTEPNRFQYVIESPTTVRLYLDPMSVAGLVLVNASGGTPSSDVDLTDKGLFPAGKDSSDKKDIEPESQETKMLRSKIMTSALSYFLPRLAEGLPLEFKTDESSLDVYIDTAMAVDLFNNIVLPVIMEDETVKALEKYLAGIPAIAPLLPQLQKALPLLPEAFKRTNSLRLGFAFVQG